MSKIICPKCHTEFDISETDYNTIIKQVRDKEFDKELKNQKSLFDNEKENAVKLAKIETENNFNEVISEKNTKIAELEKKLELFDSKKQVDIMEAMKSKDDKITDLNETIFALKNTIELNQQKSELDLKNMQEKYELTIKDKNEQIDYYKDLKAKLSTKMVGETLEQHCEIEFNKLRATGFQNSYFEKDNDAKSGSKGDYIFREKTEDGIEVVSIMFEMKNEMDTTSTKHKNEDFFKELDKDRNEKECEYAVLVSLLESDNDLYNTGIVDVSYKYPKMYVIRPQFFIPIITLLRNAALNSLQYKREIAVIQNQNIDILQFEKNMNDFKDKFSRNYRLASDKFKTAIDEIDKTIHHLEKTKEALMSSENNYRIANEKVEALTIKKLTKNCPSIAKKFEEAHNDD